MGREADLEELYEGLMLLVRRSRERSADFHPGLTLVAYTLLGQIGSRSGTRAADLASTYGLDKSTISRQIDQLERAGLLRRIGEQPGRRGQGLELTTAGSTALAEAARSVRATLVKSLVEWDDQELRSFALMLRRFNEQVSYIEPD
jgi:DNA-binding MarR family transcriptional regulator